MSDDNTHDDAVTKARTVLHEAIAAARMDDFIAMAVFAACESYAKAMRSQCESHANRSAVAVDHR